MSWTARLEDDRGHEEGWWNYTDNTDYMIAQAVLMSEGTHTAAGDHPLDKAIGPCWWDRLDGATGEEGKDYLALIIKGLESDPDLFRAVNPTNGWGSYASLLGVLRKMHGAVPDWPCRWSVSG